MTSFEKFKGNFGFGCMRLPMLPDGEVDLRQFSEMIDEYMAAGFNYFDTAHGYLAGKSETALKSCLVDKYPREDYVFANKLSAWLFEKEEDVLPLFEEQLKCCGLDYFDVYLLHAQNTKNYKKCKETNAYKIINDLKSQGKIKHFGISFHDTAEVLDKILNENPEIELVQLQFNYYDFNDEKVQSKLCYDVCLKHNKPVIVMEPVRGGNLVNLVGEAQMVLDRLNSGSNASYAIRFAASFSNVKMVLSGMSNIEQMRDNLFFMKDFKPLNEAEFDAVFEVAKIIRAKTRVSCTACGYCESECPQNIKIHSLFSALNRKAMFNTNEFGTYKRLTTNNGSPLDCIKCGKCEKVCPQNINIRDLLIEVAKELKN